MILLIYRHTLYMELKYYTPHSAIPKYASTAVTRSLAGEDLGTVRAEKRTRWWLSSGEVSSSRQLFENKQFPAYFKPVYYVCKGDWNGYYWWQWCACVRCKSKRCCHSADLTKLRVAACTNCDCNFPTIDDSNSDLFTHWHRLYNWTVPTLG